MRILVDYRPALRTRTGVGEYIHGLVGAYAASSGDTVAVFTSSWKDRPPENLATDLGVQVIDRRVPVRILNRLWHDLEWPPVEMLAGPADVVHAAHPLLIPARAAAQVVTIHDLFFLTDPSRTTAEIRRDYPRLAAPHAQRAHAVVTSSGYGRDQIVSRLGVAPDRVHVCPPGAPAWRTLGAAPVDAPDGYVLFLGTLEPRKNVGALLDAWELLLHGTRPVPMLVLAGRATPEASTWLERLHRPPLQGRVVHRGYVPGEAREALFAGALALVLPSLDEGFGLPALEAMSAGVPVIAADRGALPEVLDEAGILIDPTRPDTIAAAVERLRADRRWAHDRAVAGLARARTFTWPRAAAALRQAYVAAVDRRRAGRP